MMMMIMMSNIYANFLIRNPHSPIFQYSQMLYHVVYRVSSYFTQVNIFYLKVYYIWVCTKCEKSSIASMNCNGFCYACTLYMNDSCDDDLSIIGRNMLRIIVWVIQPWVKSYVNNDVSLHTTSLYYCWS